MLWQARFYNKAHKERGWIYSDPFRTKKEAEEWLTELKKEQPLAEGTVVEYMETVEQR